MRLYAYALFRVVARSARNRRGSLACIHGYGQCRPRQRLKNGVVGSRNAEHVVMSRCIVDCSGTSVPTVMGSLQIPAVSRETAGRSSSPPRGVGVALCGVSVFRRGQVDRWPENAASRWDSPPRGHADLSVSATNSGGKYTGELIPNPRERWFHVKPEEGRSGMAFVEVSSRRGACACSR